MVLSLSEVSNPKTKISAGNSGQNSHRKKGAENIIQMIADSIKDDVQSSNKVTLCDVISIENLNQDLSTDSLLSLAQLFDKADDTKYDKIGENKAKEIIYDKMLEHLFMLQKQQFEKTELRLPEISHKNLQRKTQKAVKIYKLFEKLTNNKVQDIIDNFSKHNDQNENNDNTDVEEESDSYNNDTDYFKSDNKNISGDSEVEESEKSDDDSNDKYDHELYEKLLHEKMARLVKLEEKIPTRPKVNDDNFDKIFIEVLEEHETYFDDPAPQSVMNSIISPATA
ncbi:hypothetical protein C1645_880467 [Glomus cerebriforme]|uniref:Uncharacterized protein n=1 Tax=Glomus cerebriforme TaxID=658196 RepID=A0A397SDA6_9GLOM|nr:hypothetical protein C1645_880467 [Glomus cerebriforme]